MPFDDVAADHESSASIGRGGIFRCELHDVSYDRQFDDLAADHESCASNGRSVIWNCELLNLPFDSQLDDGDIRSQHDRVYADQWACQRGLRIVPHEQQL